MSALTLDQAQKIISAALAHSKSKGYKAMGIVVLDEAGHLKAFAREDGATMMRYDVALGKAYGAVAFGVSSRTLAERAKDNPNFFVSLSATSEGKFLPQPGAVVIKNASGQIIGAVGASGGTGDQDEEICIAGVKSVGLQHG